MGPREAGVVESSSPQDGNKAATPEGNSITSSGTYQDKEGNLIQFTASAIPNDSEFEGAVFVVDTIPA